MPYIILLSSQNASSTPIYEQLLGNEEFSVVGHALGSAPAVDLTALHVAAIDVGERIDAAATQTRRWRAELGDQLVPILWILATPSSDWAVQGLEAGADGVLSHPLDAQLLQAQLRASVRARIATSRLEERAGEARLLGEQLQKAYRQIDQEFEAARRIQQACLPQVLPVSGVSRFAVSHRSRGRGGGGFFDVRECGDHRVDFFLGDVVASGVASGLLGLFASHVISRMKHLDDASPGEILTEMNRQLLQLELEDRPLVAMLAGTMNTRTGEFCLARAGSPAPVLLSSSGESRVLTIPGQFLGSAETSYQAITASLRPGDRLAMATDGIRPDGNPAPVKDEFFVELTIRHRATTGPAFVDALAREIEAGIQHGDDFTLLVVEHIR